jgi:hypothetical protein
MPPPPEVHSPGALFKVRRKVHPVAVTGKPISLFVHVYGEVDRRTGASGQGSGSGRQEGPGAAEITAKPRVGERQSKNEHPYACPRAGHRSRRRLSHHSLRS